MRAAAGRRPTLAVLSPYAAQVALIKDSIRRAPRGDLAHLREFATAREGGELVGTVDAFQGSEADLVIVSLVRNNARAGGSALGFLRDRRRMNVLLSRARSQLIIVGSLAFLHEAVRGVNPKNELDHDLSFLNTIRATIEELSRETREGVPLASFVRPNDLRGRS